MKLKQFEELFCFAAICEAGSITAAAKELDCSKAHVSKKVADLENRLGVKLLYRHTRQISLTPAGNRLRRQALPQYQAMLNVERQSHYVDSEMTGTFIISAPSSLCAYLLAPEMPGLEASFPKIRFQIHPSIEILDLVAEGIDLAIRAGNVVDENLIAHQIGHAREIFIDFEQDSKNTAPPPKTIEDLDDRPLYLNPFSLTDDELRLTNGSQVISFPPEHALLISDYPLLLDLAERNKGIAMAPDCCLPTMGDNARRCLEGWHGREWPIMIAYPFLSPLPAKLAAVSAYLRPRLAARLY